MARFRPSSLCPLAPSALAMCPSISQAWHLIDLPNSGENWHILALCPNKGSSQAPDCCPFLAVPPQPPLPGLLPPTPLQNPSQRHLSSRWPPNSNLLSNLRAFSSLVGSQGTTREGRWSGEKSLRHIYQSVAWMSGGSAWVAVPLMLLERSPAWPRRPAGDPQQASRNIRRFMDPPQQARRGIQRPMGPHVPARWS